MKNICLVKCLLFFSIQLCFTQNSIEIQKNAISGDADAQYELAELLKEQSDSLHVKKQAFNWAMKSAKQGNEKAQDLLGRFYAYEPEVVENDIQKAIYWFEKSAKKNYCHAYISLGWLYSGFFKDDKSLQIALDWFQKGIELNCLSVMEALGSMYLYDERLPNRLENGLKWIEKAANLGDVYAQYTLGGFYDYPEYASEGLNLKQDVKKAIYWYEKAAKNNDIGSMYFLASILDKEEHTTVYSIKKANFWYKFLIRSTTKNTKLAKLIF